MVPSALAPPYFGSRARPGGCASIRAVRRIYREEQAVRQVDKEPLGICSDTNSFAQRDTPRALGTTYSVKEKKKGTVDQKFDLVFVAKCDIFSQYEIAFVKEDASATLLEQTVLQEKLCQQKRNTRRQAEWKRSLSTLPHVKNLGLRRQLTCTAEPRTSEISPDEPETKRIPLTSPGIGLPYENWNSSPSAFMMSRTYWL